MKIFCNHTWVQNNSTLMIQMPSLPSHFKRVPIFQVSYNTTKHFVKLLILVNLNNQQSTTYIHVYTSPPPPNGDNSSE